MPTLSPAQIYALARDAGLSAAGATTATAVALAESAGNTDAVGDVGIQDASWGPSVGLWQIRSLKAQYGTGGPRDASRLADPKFNAASMASISGKGGSWKPWSTYQNGSYKKYVQQVSGSVNSAGVSGDSPSTMSKISAIVGGIFGGLTGNAVGGAVVGAEAPAAVDNALSGWAKGAFGIGLKIVGAGAAAALVIVGAVHTVSN